MKILKRIVADATSALGKNSRVPTREEIEEGSASYAGIPIKYKPAMNAEAQNFTDVIWVSDKFFNYDEDTQQHILNHEVAHNFSDEMMREHTSDWNEFCSKFIQEKEVPESSSAYRNGQRTYWEGLYGDIGAISLSETLTNAIVEYFDNPNRLKQRSMDAYNEIDKFIKNRI